MSNFKSLTHARKCLTLAKNKINKILKLDLPSVREEDRNLDLWYKKFQSQPGCSEKVETVRHLEQNLMDAEIYIICSKPTIIDTKALFGR